MATNFYGSRVNYRLFIRSTPRSFYAKANLRVYARNILAIGFPLCRHTKLSIIGSGNLPESLQIVVFELFGEITASADYHFEEDCPIDSMPIMLAVRVRSYRAKVARELANQSYCASKDIWYHGVKLHLLARKQYRRLPKPEMMKITSASEADLRILQEFEGKIVGNVFGNKADKDEKTEREFKEQGVMIYTPDKKQKHREGYEVGKSGLWSRFVSAMRQPIESLFNWINEKTAIQNGSKIRSLNGLLVHCYGKLAVSLFSLCFNY